MPYTYRISWTEHDVHYYGVRLTPNSHPEDDLWNSYFTSSKYVNQFRDNFGEPDIIEIRRVFDNKEDAVQWEQKVLCRLKVRINSRWINRYDTSYKGSLGPKGPQSESHKKARSNAIRKKSRIWLTNGYDNTVLWDQDPHEFIRKNPEWKIGRTIREETREKMRGKNNPMYGIPRSEKLKSDHSNRMKGNKHSLGKVWYTDGKKNLQLNSNEDIPDGFRRGMTQNRSKRK